MLEPKEIERYKRQISLKDIGLKGQVKLKQAKVLVVGAGGLGCPLIQYLSAAGIGTIGVVDGDIVSQSNLARQILFNQNDIGKNKASVVQEKVAVLNPYTNVIIFTSFLNAEVALNIFNDFDLIIDCTDNFAARYIINDVCVLYKLPFISAAISEYEGQIANFNFPIGKDEYSCTYRDLYPDIPNTKVHLNCEDSGVLATLPGIVALYQSNEALKFFLQTKLCLVNTLHYINPWNSTHFQMNIEKTHHEKLTKAEIEKYNYESSCSKNETVKNLTLNECKNLQNGLWIDVREPYENPINIKGICSSYPLSDIEAKLDELKDVKTLLFFCNSGKRSAEAAVMAKQKFPEKEIYNIIDSAQKIKNNIYETAHFI